MPRRRKPTSLSKIPKYLFKIVQVSCMRSCHRKAAVFPLILPLIGLMPDVWSKCGMYFLFFFAWKAVLSTTISFAFVDGNTFAAVDSSFIVVLSFCLAVNPTLFRIVCSLDATDAHAVS